jgi:hypothetical protein
MERIVWLLLVVFYAASVWRLYADGWGRPDAAFEATTSRPAMRVLAGGRSAGVVRSAPAPRESEERTVRTWS